MRPPPLIRALAAILSALWRWITGPHNPHGWSSEFIASEAFLRTHEWSVVRYQALKANDGRCELCGASKHDGARLNVDHIKPRARYPHLALDVRNLQVLDDHCNRGKGNRDMTDWREPGHPHRQA